MQLLERAIQSLRPVLLTFLIATVALAALSACTGGDDSDDETPAPTPTGSINPTLGPGAGEFEQLATKYVEGVDGRVTYAIDSENFGIHPQGTWATYRLNTEIREDWTQNANGYEEKSVAIVADDGYFFCSQTPFSVSCSQQPSVKELEVVLVTFTTVKDVPPALLSGMAEYTTEELPDETIAGETAKCFDVAVNGRIGGGPPGTEQVKLCYREDGALLKMERRVIFADPAFKDAVLNVTAQETGEALETDFDLPVSPTQPQG
jgi:hypothetical protein